MEMVYSRQSKNRSVRNRDVTWASGTDASWHKKSGPPTPLVGWRDIPVKWGFHFDQLTAAKKKHAWLTDGSAKYIGDHWHWKAVAYNPIKGQTQVAEGSGQTSQYVKLYAVFQALQTEFGKECYLFTDSWSVANGLTTWILYGLKMIEKLQKRTYGENQSGKMYGT